MRRAENVFLSFLAADSARFNPNLYKSAFIIKSKATLLNNS